MNHASLKGKTSVLIGGGGPLAREVTQRFLAEGANVVIGWHAPEEWEEARRLIDPRHKDQVVELQIDAADEKQVETLMRKAKEEFGRIDFLIHMAGLFYAGAKFWETEAEVFDRLIEVNLKTAFLCCKHAIKIMLEKGSGRIVLFPARAVLHPRLPFSVYAVSEIGLTAMISALREELKDTRITVNGIMPSVIDTPRTRKMAFAEATKGVKPVEIADIVCSLCSDQCEALNGSILNAFGEK
jgi:NAD(P)-dependent dehydrogenase (short-subunit alcohol dehydrogenase family)